MIASLNVPSLQTPLVLPFALSLVMQRLSAPWQIIRLAIKIAASDDEIRVAATPYGVAVTMALHDLARVAASLRADIKRGQFENVADHLKTMHDGVRGLRTELDLRNDSPGASNWPRSAPIFPTRCNRRSTAFPAGCGGCCASAPTRIFPPAPGSTRPRSRKPPHLIDFVAVCRTYASELAINEVTLRTYSDLQHYVEQSTEALVQSLRGADQQRPRVPAAAGQGRDPLLRGAVRP